MTEKGDTDMNEFDAAYSAAEDAVAAADALVEELEADLRSHLEALEDEGPWSGEGEQRLRLENRLDEAKVAAKAAGDEFDRLEAAWQVAEDAAK